MLWNEVLKTKEWSKEPTELVWNEDIDILDTVEHEDT
jgi:hypothetical protein